MVWIRVARHSVPNSREFKVPANRYRLLPDSNNLYCPCPASYGWRGFFNCLIADIRLHNHGKKLPNDCRQEIRKHSEFSLAYSLAHLINYINLT